MSKTAFIFRALRDASMHIGILGCVLLIIAPAAVAHPMAENVLDIVISPDRIIIDARISMEEILVAESKGVATNARDHWVEWSRTHGDYVLKHLRVRVDGNKISGHRVPDVFGPTTQPAASASSLIPYRFEYPLTAVPGLVQIDQNLLLEFDAWTAACVVRIRQSDVSEFTSTSLNRESGIELRCEWQPGAATQPAAPVTTKVLIWPTIREYTRHGIVHILTGYDHLLFVSALVLAATQLWDLIKVVTAFTVAHTLTLILSVFNIVTLGEHIVEPMIAASIVFVALQNIFFPRQSRGWTRLAIAFAFGLFHGLGFAGGLKDAMVDMPRSALWTALIAFSLGVEVGHQLVVLPLFAALSAIRNWNAPTPRTILAGRLLRVGSIAIAVAGVYFLVQALRL